MPFEFPRCEAVPVDGYQVSFRIDGQERLRWHAGTEYPRPFFYPVVGPSGTALTRIGHPGAPDHDHHRSVWFAHHKVSGVDFWSDRSTARIRQTGWLCYQDGREAIMAVTLAWNDGHDPKPLLTQELTAAVRPGPIERETVIEIQSRFVPTADSLEFGKTNFGILAVRMAKHLSVYFGGGHLTNSAGKSGEPAIFGQPAEWVDYSGPAPKGGTEGITFIGHPSNPGHPNKWHVREDGWMGCSLSYDSAVATTKKSPLTVRYMLYVHGTDHLKQIPDLLKAFSADRPYEVVKPGAGVKHTMWSVRRQA